MRTFDIVIAGSGPAGLAAAAACAQSGAQIGLVSLAVQVNTPPDTRTAALFPGSLALLHHIGAMTHLAGAIAPMRGIRIVDDGDGLLRAPEVVFEAHEMGMQDFGANVPQQALGSALLAAVKAVPNVQFIEGRVTGLDEGNECAKVHLDGGTSLSARLVVAADGRNSICRAAAGIAAETWDYPQVAIAAQFSHSRPHHGISTEFHRTAGPCTVVPMPGNSSSLVWVERPAIAERLGGLDDAAFARALEDRLHGVLGRVSQVGIRRLFPLGGLKAECLARNRVVLVGEAGHTLPPIGAQGLNLGFRDVAVLADLAAGAMASSRDIGGAELLDAYHAARRADVAVRTVAVDLLNRSLLADLLPADLARGLGLHLAGGIAVLKRQVMRAGFEPVGSLPRLMRMPLAATSAA